MSRSSVSDYSTDTNRFRTLHVCLVVCGIFEQSGRWMTVIEASDEMRTRYGEMSDRTVRRYIKTLESIGVLEQQRNTAHKGFWYRWVGWPVPVA